jgi:hypothetical protein
MRASHMETVAEIKTGKDIETMACRETMEAHLDEKPTSVDKKPEVAQQRENVRSM